ncbi:MAG: FHA domain-containing protein [Bacteroidales bacterium]|nr:FHA domain-containing protein [Bacteroidales bacterium]
MIQCPECRALIPDDSVFCDQCGKELKWCPQCGRPKRGTECPVCGSALVSRIGGEGSPEISPRASLGRDDNGGNGRDDKNVVIPSDPSVIPSAAKESASALVGNGWRLVIQEGAFGRRGGMWPELATCPYVSGSHGVISKAAGGWTITDSGSTNGTYVNDKRIAPGVPTAMAIGDRVRIANLEFTVE